MRKRLTRRSVLSGENKQRRKSIFVRTFVMITALCTALIVLPTVMFIPMARNGWLKGLESQARSLSASIAEVSGNAFVTGDYSFIVDHNTQVMRGSRDIRYIIIVKNDGSSLVHTGTAWEQREKPDPKWRLDKTVSQAGRLMYSDVVKEDVYHYSFPLQLSGIDWGVLYLGLSLKDYQTQVGRILPAAIAFSLPALALAMLVAFLIARRITSPILILRNTADHIMQGDLTARADINSGDEVQDLAGSFNRMTDTILKSQDDIASARDYIENILRSLAECLIVFHTDKTIELVNKATIELLGYEENELIGKSIEVLFSQYDGFLEPAEIDRAATQGITSNLEKYLLTKEGMKFPVLFSYGPLKGRDGGILGLVGIALDITEQKTSQTLLEKSREEAVAANRAKSEFLANMSHEIRTPMNGILGMLDMLIHSHLDKDQKRFADTAYSSANILLSILNDILDLSKIEAGKMELETIDFDIRDALDDVANLFSARIKTKLLSLRITVDDQLSTAVQGDPVRFRQIITNLVGNAVKFTDAGEIVVRATRLEQDDEKIFLRFAISDTGVGIDDEAKKKIFDSFTQADASTTRKHGGTGLGLSISRELVALMGGTIGVESTPGKGSTFWFTARFKRSHANLARNSSALSKTTSDKSPADILQSATDQAPRKTPEMRSGLCILLAEDNLVNQDVISAMLSHLPISIHTVSNGREAIESLSSKSYDLVLMDCQMPELDGYEATKILRDRENNSQVSRTPVIALTANAMQGDREKCLSAGMDDYLAKPFNIQELTSILNKWLGPISTNTESASLSPDGPERTVAVDIEKPKSSHKRQASNSGCSENGTGELSPRQEDRMEKPQLDGENLLTLTKTRSATSDNGTGPGILQRQAEHGETEARSPVIDMSVLDKIRALQREGAPDLVGKLVSLYLTEASGIIASIGSAIDEKNTQDVFRLAHKLKSSSANVGALHLSSQLKELEALGRQNEIEETVDLFAAIEKEFKAVRKSLETLIPNTVASR